MKYYAIIILILMLQACATPITPPGGSKDVVAPQVLLQLPQSGMANYSGNRIEILFDEYITFSGGEDKVIITPDMPQKPTYIVKGKKLIIKLPENLQKDVTYSISLIDAVSDFTEGNKIPLLRHVFSTGAKIDSASISGSVLSAFDLAPVAEVFVGLYPSDTVVDLKSKPIYVSRTNSQGQFRIDYVKEGNYVLAAIEDKNFNFIFDQATERISLPSSVVSLKGNTILENGLLLFENESKIKVDGYKLLNNNKLYFYFSEQVEDLGLDVDAYNSKDKVYFNDNKDTLFYHWTSDTIKALTFKFLLNNNSNDTIVVPLSKNVLDLDLSVKSSFPVNKNIVVRTAKFIEELNSENISIKDSLGNNLKFSVRSDKEFVYIKLLDKTKGILSLSLDSASVKYHDDSYNEKLFQRDISIEDAKEESKLILNYPQELRANIYLQLLNKDKALKASYLISNTNSLSLKDLNPGSYFIRIYQDINANGKWTTGSLERTLAPEATLLFSNPVELKDKWDKEISLSF